MSNKNEKKDFLDRKAGFIERMFDRLFSAVKEDIKSMFIVILIITNLFMFYSYQNSLEIRLTENQEYSERMIKEIKRQLQPEIERSVNERASKLETKVDSASHSLDRLKEAIEKSIK